MRCFPFYLLFETRCTIIAAPISGNELGGRWPAEFNDLPAEQRDAVIAAKSADARALSIAAFAALDDEQIVNANNYKVSAYSTTIDNLKSNVSRNGKIRLNVKVCVINASAIARVATACACEYFTTKFEHVIVFLQMLLILH